MISSQMQPQAVPTIQQISTQDSKQTMHNLRLQTQVCSTIPLNTQTKEMHPPVIDVVNKDTFAQDAKPQAYTVTIAEQQTTTPKHARSMEIQHPTPLISNNSQQGYHPTATPPPIPTPVHTQNTANPSSQQPTATNGLWAPTSQYSGTITYTEQHVTHQHQKSDRGDDTSSTTWHNTSNGQQRCE